VRVELDEAELEAELDRAFAEIAQDLTVAVRGMSIEIWDIMLKQTPQLYGRMVASWTYSLDMPVYVDRSDMIDQSKAPARWKARVTKDSVPRQTLVELDGWRKGSPEAIRIANAASAGMPDRFQLGQTIWMANGVNHGDGHYGLDIEEGRVNLRKVNQPGTPRKIAVDKITVKYAEGIWYWDLEKLKKKRIGNA
jgi:hypothetical protein